MEQTSKPRRRRRHNRGYRNEYNGGSLDKIKKTVIEKGIQIDYRYVLHVPIKPYVLHDLFYYFNVEKKYNTECQQRFIFMKAYGHLMIFGTKIINQLHSQFPLLNKMLIVIWYYYINQIDNQNMEEMHDIHEFMIHMFDGFKRLSIAKTLYIADIKNKTDNLIRPHVIDRSKLIAIRKHESWSNPSPLITYDKFNENDAIAKMQTQIEFSAFYSTVIPSYCDYIHKL